MTSVKDILCLVTDLGGFFVKKKFRAGKGFYSWNEQFGRHAFFMPTPFNDLSKRDKKTKLCKIQNPWIDISTE